MPNRTNFNMMARRVLSGHWVMGFHGYSSLACSTQIHRKMGPLAKAGQMSTTVPCRRILQIYEMSVYLLKWKCLSLFVSVLQWIKDALIDKHLFMISGTSCYWTADGALDCGIVMAGYKSLLLILTDVGCELICIHDPYFFTLCWLTYTHISVTLHMSTEKLWSPT